MSWMLPWSRVIEVIFGGFSIETNAGGPANKLAAAPAVVMLTLHPPAKLPASPGPSSRTFNDHVPLASVPLKTAKIVPNDPAGAGAG